jgi:hypothetical protein
MARKALLFGRKILPANFLNPREIQTPREAKLLP